MQPQCFPFFLEIRPIFSSQYLPLKIQGQNQPKSNQVSIDRDTYPSKNERDTKGCSEVSFPQKSAVTGVGTGAKT